MALTLKELPQHGMMVRNILNTYYDATQKDVAEGETWYERAYEMCREYGERYGFRPTQVAGVMAVVSPGMVWDENESAPLRVLNLYSRGIRYEAWAGFSTYPANLKKAQEILDGDFNAISGRKVVPFFGNICGVTDIVTVDRWAIRVALADPKLGKDKIVPSTQKVYDAIADAYKDAARLGEREPCDMQAITWCAYRNRYYGRVREQDMGVYA